MAEKTKNDIADAIDAVGEVIVTDPAAVVIVETVKQKISRRVRGIIYWVGISLGAVAAVGGAVAASLTGNAAYVAGVAVGVAYSLSNLIARLNLSGT